MCIQRNLRDGLIVSACVLQLAAPLSAIAKETSSKQTDLLIERPSDLPGRPALPVPGAPPARKIRFGTATSIQVNVDVTGANIPGDAANEPSLAVDPANPNTLAIGWRQFDTTASNFRQAGYAYSTDGGRTWTFPGVLEPTVFRSDPVLSFDVAGNFYYNSLKVVGNAFNSWVFKSSDGGASLGCPCICVRRRQGVDDDRPYRRHGRRAHLSGLEYGGEPVCAEHVQPVGRRRRQLHGAESSHQPAHLGDAGCGP